MKPISRYNELYNSKRSFLLEGLATDIKHNMDHLTYSSSKTVDQIVNTHSEMGAMTESDKALMTNILSKRIETERYHKRLLDENGITEYFTQPDIQKKLLDNVVENVEENMQKRGINTNLAWIDFNSMVTFELSHAILREAYDSPVRERIESVARENNLLNQNIKNQEISGKLVDNQMADYIFNAFSNYITYVMVEEYNNAVKSMEEMQKQRTEPNTQIVNKFDKLF